MPRKSARSSGAGAMIVMAYNSQRGTDDVRLVCLSSLPRGETSHRLTTPRTSSP
jgi:hypothetical protein